MEVIKKQLEKKISRSNEKLEGIKKEHGDDPGTTHTYHGGQQLGYYQGRISAFEDVEDILEDFKEEKIYVETPLINFNMYFAANPIGASVKVLCLFKVNGKEYKIEEDVSDRKATRGTEFERKKFLIEYIYEKVSKVIVHRVLSEYDFESLKV